MQYLVENVAFVIATKDRPNDLRNLLKSISSGTHIPSIIIVDASSPSVKPLLDEFLNLNIKYIHHNNPSASEQRNIGVKLASSKVSLLGFLDDDAIVENHAIENMIRFFRNSVKNVGGASFNLMNPPKVDQLAFKESGLAHRLGLYSNGKGVVMPSGWQTLTGNVKKNTYVEWLTTAAVLWRKEIFNCFQFDEFFDGYSYLEDLDFSYRVSKKYRLCIVANAEYWHYPSPYSRISPYLFGKIEVRNRLYFVKKNSLSIKYFYFSMTLRSIYTFASSIYRKDISQLWRFLGNLMMFFSFKHDNAKS